MANATSAPTSSPTPRAPARRRPSTAINNAIPADWRDDALFAVDRDGQVVAQVGLRRSRRQRRLRLGGYPAVNDALHGWLRDDVWLLGSKMYVVVARPVEYDATQRPAGAIVGLKEVNERFVTDLAKRTRTAIAFYAAGQKVAGGVGAEGFDAENLDAVAPTSRRSTTRPTATAAAPTFACSPTTWAPCTRACPATCGAWAAGSRWRGARTALGGPMGFLSNADDKDKANVPWGLLVGIVVLASLIGIGFSVLEHTLPLRELVTQGERYKAGAMEQLAVSRFRGAYRLAAQNINLGMERVIEKSGGVTRKPADLESIIGPVPAQPATHCAFGRFSPEAAESTQSP